MILSNKYSNDRKDNFLNKMMEVWIVNKKKITILACTLFMVMSLGACGKAKEDDRVNDAVYDMLEKQKKMSSP